MAPSSAHSNESDVHSREEGDEGSVTCNKIKHVLCVVLLAAIIYINISALTYSSPDAASFNVEEHLWQVVVVHFIRLLVLFTVPFSLFNFFGIVGLNTFPRRPRLQRSPLLAPFLCFRVVTRGLFPKLVHENIQRNLGVCSHLELQNFIFEVVTDEPLQLPRSSRVREVVVPRDYRTRHGSLFKARALQYSLEPEVDILAEDDWIVHLDEETVLTEEALVGIINFVAEGRHDFGQGVITYSKDHIVNWVTTLADSVRVGVDYGSLRFTLKVLHRPIFSWKGSFIVANSAAEKRVSFDHGPESSIAEDCFFAMVAFKLGYSFGFVDGEMLEKSTFTFRDYVHQRKRWMQGIYLTALSCQLPLRYKLGPVLMTICSLCLPLTTLNMLLTILYPVPVWLWLNCSVGFCSSMIVFLFVLGTMKSFSIRRYGVLRCSLFVLSTLACSILIIVFENVASILAFWTPSKHEFYVVKKEVRSRDIVL